ncbi:MAG: T9SS type A sorting domain-containing protein [Burkholderiales bacterium]|nr:T9SS type A sorting domain-containing protein [Flavobacterium sp.]
MKCKKNILLFLFVLVFSNSKAQTMFVRPITGTQTAYVVANIKKLTFSGGNLVVTNSTGSNDTFDLASNRYLNFTDLTLATTTHELVTNRFYVYPNPVTSILHLTNQDQSQTISRLAIITLQGRLLLEQNVINPNIAQVDLATLPQGMYFCKITSNNQTQTIKFLKQ